MTTDRYPCPVARMDPLAREFLALCHAEAHHRSVQAGQPPAVPPLRAGLSVARPGRRVLGRVGCQGITAKAPNAAGTLGALTSAPYFAQLRRTHSKRTLTSLL